jgi:ATP-binding cassette subfamily B protein
MRLLWKYIRQHKLILFGGLVLASINQVFSLLDPQIFRLMVDNYILKAAQLPRNEFISGVFLLLLGSMGVALVSRVAKNFQDYFVSIITQRVGARLYEDSIHHSFSLPYQAFEDQRSGELLQKLQKARTDSQLFITQFISVVFLTIIGIVFIIFYAISVHILIGVVYVAIIPVMASLMYYLTSRIKKVQKEIVTQTAALAGSTTETLRNVELVKSLGLEEQESQRLNVNNQAILDLELKKIRLIRVLSFIQGTTVNGIRSGLLFLLIWLIFTQKVSFGEFFTLYFYLFFIFEPLQQLGNVANQYQETAASMEKLQQILDMKPEPKPENAVTLSSINEIQFKGVGFAYNETGKASVTDINLTISKGLTVALVGPSGAGKTTMAKLLLGLYHPTGGQLLFNDEDSNSIDFDALRRRIGYVSQDTQLFAGTIRENLLFVRPDATDEECLDAMRKASAMPIVERGGEGLNTKIGEGGIKISGGERQRLAIARALLRNPDLIIFDEATSSLDSLTEKEITETIKQATSKKPNLITVMIAHRLSTIAHADVIYVLEQGRLSEKGTHQELLQNKGLYAALWREQSTSL